MGRTTGERETKDKMTRHSERHIKKGMFLHSTVSSQSALHCNPGRPDHSDTNSGFSGI